MKLLLDRSVWDAALERIRWIYDEFDDVVVNISGGKDSTVIYHLSLQVAEELGRLPQRVMFVDQEAEWDSTIDVIRASMDDPRVDPAWLQVPFRLFNASSPLEPWLHCWEPGADWMRPKEPDSIHDNVYGTDRFAKLYTAFAAHHYPDRPVAFIAGVRTEESPARHFGLTTYPCWKHVTWGTALDKKRSHITFYPIYDWATADVWHAIHANRWRYSTLYDDLYRYGIPVREMRVSNLHHETAVRSLFIAQEIEPDTWNRLTARLSGLNTASQLNWAMFKPRELPPMFADWVQYRDHLLYNLVVDPEIRERMRARFETQDAIYRHDAKAYADLVTCEISSILVNDWEGVKLSTFHATHMSASKNRGAKSGVVDY